VRATEISSAVSEKEKEDKNRELNKRIKKTGTFWLLANQRLV